MRLIFVHGWSVSNTDTYGSLPQILASLASLASPAFKATSRQLSLSIIDIHFGRYIGFRDEVRMDDLVRAFDPALREALPDRDGGIHCGYFKG